MTETYLVRPLEKAWSEPRMHFVGGAENEVRDFAVYEINVLVGARIHVCGL
jgi:hypothetical protein